MPEDTLTASEAAAERLYAVADGLRDTERWCTDHRIDFGASPGVVLAAVRDELQQAAAALAVS
jgi:hypothetical protein